MHQAEPGHNELGTNRLLLIVAAAVAVYAGGLNGAFQFDDYHVIVDNEVVHSFSAWASDLMHGIRPLLKLSYTLNWTLGWGPFGFHLFNTAVHAANCVLIYILAQRLLTGFSLPAWHREFAAFGAALLFAVHPVQTEAVSYICGRSMSFMALFYLGSILAFDYGVESNRKTFSHLLSPLLFLAAFAVRETAMSLPLALALWQISKKHASVRELVGNLSVHIALFSTIVVALLVHSGYRTLILDSLSTRALGVNLLSQVTAWCYLLSRFVMIHRLNADPDLPFASTLTPVIVIQAAVLLSLMAVALVLFRKRPWIGFGLLWFFLHLLPTNSFIPRLDLANERHLYVAGWGLFIACSVEVSFLLKPGAAGSRAFITVLALLLLVLSIATVVRNGVYRTEVSFWQDAVTKASANARAHNNLGYAYFLAGRRQDAAAEYHEAIRLRPGYERADENLRSLLALGNENSSAGKGN